MKLRIKCKYCGKEHIVDAPEDGLRAYHNGTLIQRALPNLSASDRELIMTQICSECWDRIMKVDEE